MNDHLDFERLVAGHIADEGVTPPSDAFYDELFTRAARTGPRPEWLALIKESPMRTNSHLAVGSPTVRVVAILAATLLLALTLAATGAAAQRLLAAGPIVVAADGSGHYTTIQAALDAAEGGDEILVEPGTYPEAVIIDKDISLRGSGPRGEVVLEYGEDGPTIPSWSGPVPYGLMLVDTDATVSDLTVRGPRDGVAFVLVGGAPTLERVANEHGGEYADQAQMSVGPLQGAGATIRESSLSGPVYAGGVGPLSGYEGVTGSGKWVIEDSTDDGFIALGGVTDGSQIVRNVTTSDIELYLEGGGTLLVADNDTTAIELDEPSGDGVTIRDNVLHGASDDSAAIVLGSGTPIVEGNVITEARTGITVPMGGTPRISKNQLKGLDVAILMLAAESVPVIEGNVFCDNARNLVVAGSGSEEALDPSNAVCEDAPAG